MNFGGTLSISSGSTMASAGHCEKSAPFSCVMGLVMTEPASTSEPVPALVVIATKGSSGALNGRCSEVPVAM